MVKTSPLVLYSITECTMEQSSSHLEHFQTGHYNYETLHCIIN